MPRFPLLEHQAGVPFDSRELRVVPRVFVDFAGAVTGDGALQLQGRLEIVVVAERHIACVDHMLALEA